MQNFMIWAKQIFVLSIVLQLINHLAANGKYHRYLHYIGGVMMITLTLIPVGKCFLREDIVSGMTLKSFCENPFQQVLHHDKSQRDRTCTDKQQAADKVCQCMKRDIAALAKEEGVETGKVEIMLDMDEQSKQYGSIVEIAVWLEDTPQSKQESGQSDSIQVDPIKIQTTQMQQEYENENKDTQQRQLRTKIAQFYKLDLETVHIYG